MLKIEDKSKSLACNKFFVHFRGVGLALVLLALSSFTTSAIAQVRVTLNFTNAPATEVFQEIKNQTQSSIVYNMSDLDLRKTVSIRAQNEELSSVLDKILSPLGLTYSMNNNNIVISKKVATTGSSPKNITGVVVNKNNESLIGVSVVVKGTTTGIITDIDGNFALSVPENGTTLVATYVGMTPQEVTIGRNTHFNITMEESAIVIDDVIVTALGIKRSEKALSYNAQQVSGDNVTTVKDANFVNSLTGKVAGLNINSSSTGIGGASKVVIRGSKSIERDNNVLYVIDGLPMTNFSRGALESNGMYSSQPTGGEGIGDLNPDDIESMTVLTGPAAAALYGSSAANGAIVITTKKGHEGKAKVVVSNQSSFMTPFVMPKFQNTYRNLPTTYASWGEKMDTPSSFDPANFFNTGTNIQNTVSLSVGNKNNQTYVSASTTNAGGIIPNNKYNRYNFTARNTTVFFQDKMTLDFGLNYVMQNNQNMIAQGVYFNPIVAVYTFPRGEDFNDVRMFEEYNAGREINTQRWKWGDQSLNMQNPYWATNRNVFSSKRSRYILNGSLKYDIFDWMNVVGRIRVDNANMTEERKLHASTLSLFAEKNGSYGRGLIDEKQTYADVMVNINKYFATDYSLSANIGASIQDVNYELSGYTGNIGNIPNLFALRGINQDDPKTRVLEDQWRQQTQSVFANVELGWKSMVYLTLTGRNDWDSALAGMPQKSFFYPSVGLSGVISEMVNMPKFISYLKVRGSWAQVGSSIPYQLSIPSYSFNEGLGGWDSNTFMPIEQLYPEDTKSWEAGLNVRFFANKLDLNVTLYKSNTYNQTIRVPISSGSGYSAVYAQTGNIENKGLEASLKYTQKWKDFSWTSMFTASANRNKVIDLGRYTDPTDGILKDLDQQTKVQIGSSMIMIAEGGTLGDLWTTSIVKKDENGDTYVNPQTGGIATEYKLKKVGTILPDWNFGFSNSFNWKGIDLGFVISARLGGKVISYTQAVLDFYGVSEATAVARDNGGVPVNNGTVAAEDWYTVVGGPAGVFSHYVYSATNVRLQEASIGYSLPMKWFDNKVKVSASLVGRNLLMIYNKAPFDPEATASTGNYYQGLDYFMTPSLKNMGFSLKFEF